MGRGSRFIQICTYKKRQQIGKLNLKIPKDKDPHHVTYEEVLELATKAEKEPASAGKKRVINAKKVVKKK